MQITSDAWNRYITQLDSINSKAADLIMEWIEKNGIEDRKALIDYAYRLSKRYGTAAAELTCQMYDAIAIAQGARIASAIPAETATAGEVGKAINGSLKQSKNGQLIQSVVYRLCKQAAADTMLQNAARNGAQYAWVPHGDTCAFCIALASNGWKRATKELQNSHAEHIHANCDCQFCVRFDKHSGVAGYDPDEYYEIYDNSNTDSYGMKNGHWQNMSTAKINAMRRANYAKNREQILEQKRIAYQNRKHVN